MREVRDFLAFPSQPASILRIINIENAPISCNYRHYTAQIVHLCMENG